MNINMECFFIVFSCIVLLGSSMPLDSTYEDYESEPYFSSLYASQPFSGSLEEDSVIVKRDITVTKDNDTAKVTPEQSFLLADVLHQIESSLLKSALEIVAILNTSNKTDDDINNEANTTFSVAEHALRKREVEDNSTITTTSEATKPIYTRLSTRSMSSTSDKPAHISVDRITVYVADPGNFPMIPAFEIDPRMHKKQNQADKEKQTSASPATEKSTEVTSNEMSSTSSTTVKIAKRSVITTEMPKAASDDDTSKKSSDGSTTPKMSSSTKESPITSTTPRSSTSQSSTTKSSSSSASSTTPKNPVEQLKEKEEEVKEQAAEIEAEPVILSSRV